MKTTRLSGRGALCGVAPAFLIALVAVSCDRGDLSGAQGQKSGELSVQPSTLFGSRDSAPTEWPLIDADGKSVEFRSLSGPLLSVFVRDEVPSEESVSLVNGPIGLDEIFLIDSARTVPVPEGGMKLLLIPSDGTATSVSVNLRLLDKKPLRSSIRYVQQVADAYIPIDSVVLWNGDEFYVETEFDQDPGELSRVVWCEWEGGAQEPIEVFQVNGNPRLFRSRLISSKKKDR